jgi:hypothetical protein
MPNMKKPVGKVRKTQAQIDAELAAAKKAFEKYKATRPSKEKLAEMYKAQQSRIGRSKTAASAPARRSNASPAPLGTPSARPTGRRPVMPRTTKKAPAKPVKKQEKMTPQDAAMKKILEGKYGKIYG